VSAGEGSTAIEMFGRLYDEYMPRVFRYVHYRVNSTEVAEDITSTVFEKALKSFSSYSHDKASFGTWLFSIARNAVVDHYRKGGRSETGSLEAAIEFPADEFSPEEELDRRDERHRLRVCLEDLAEDEREIVRLKFGAELNNRQIANMVRLSESNVGTKLYRAVRKLRDCFKRLDNG